VKVSVEATKDKISEAYWGKIVKVPKTCMDELIRVYLQDHPEVSLKLAPMEEGPTQGNGS